MAKAILMSINPKYVSMILNKTKTIEIRKKFPSDYVGWVYIYCTKNGGKPYDGLVWDSEGKGLVNSKLFPYAKNCPEHDRLINGKVVARFWCDKVEEIFTIGMYHHETKTLDKNELLRLSCLSHQELDNYLQGNNGYAIHITKLEIFDKPREISEFRIYCDKHFSWWKNKCLDCKAYTPDTDIEDYCNKNKLALTRAPESWCYVEI